MTRLLKTLVALAVLYSPLALGVSSASARPPQPVHVPDALEETWSVETKGAINIAPLMVGDLVIVVPTGKPMHAFNAKTGKVAWTYTAAGGVWNRGFSSDGERVYVCIKGGRIAALNVKDGREVWRRDLGINCQRPQHIDGDTLFVPTTYIGPGLAGIPLPSAKLFALNRFNGSTEWVFKSKNYLLQTPATYGDTIYVGGAYMDPTFQGGESGSTRMYALDRKTQKIKWSFTALDGVPKKLHATKDHLIYAGYDDFVFKVDAKTGKKVWTHNTGNWIPSLVVEGNRIYYGSATTIVFSIDINDGNPVWEYHIPGPAFNYLLIKPVLTKDRVYFLSQRGYTVALDKATGKEIWLYETGMGPRVGLSVSSDGYIYIGASNGDLRAYKIMK